MLLSGSLLLAGIIPLWERGQSLGPQSNPCWKYWIIFSNQMTSWQQPLTSCGPSLFYLRSVWPAQCQLFNWWRKTPGAAVDNFCAWTGTWVSQFYAFHNQSESVVYPRNYAKKYAIRTLRHLGQLLFVLLVHTATTRTWTIMFHSNFDTLININGELFHLLYLNWYHIIH